jgi:hypothetical protein
VVDTLKICSVEGCNRKHVAKGYCDKHYRQYKKYGETQRTRFDSNEIIEYEDYAEIVLYNKQCEEVARALIDLDDIERVSKHKWYLISSTGYIHCKSANILLHRFIMNPQDDMVVDHINHNKFDNRKSNLRACTQQQNSMNKNMRSNNTSGTVGVSWDKTNRKWIAYIGLNSKIFNLGYYNTLEEATEARKQAEIDYFGEYRNDNEDVI